MPRYVTPEETYQCILKWSIIDVRSRERYEQGHIQGARWMSSHEPLRIAREKFEKNEKFVLYDESDADHTAEQVASQLEADGFTGVSVMQGGYLDWMKHHYPNKKLQERTPWPRRT